MAPRRQGGEGKRREAEEEELRLLCARVQQGDLETVQRLVTLALRGEAEREGLRRRIQKQEQDFRTLFEVIGRTSARSLDSAAMETYVLRTISGHFTTSRLLIARRLRDEVQHLDSSSSQGLHDAKLRLALDSPFCAEGLRRGEGFSLEETPAELQAQPEAVRLRQLELEYAVPLIREVDFSAKALEGFLFLGKRLSNRMYAPHEMKFLESLGRMLAICFRNESLYRRSIIDDLTGVYSRGHLEARLSEELGRLHPHAPTGLGLIMLDVDHFKEFNDRHGHQTGDRVLQELAATLLGQVRNVDFVARYGGEEFTVVLLEVDQAQVVEVAHRLRRAIEALRVCSLDGTPLQVTASLGAASYPQDGTSKAALLQQADRALYTAKDRGRNLVVMASSLPPSPPAKSPASG